MFEFFRFIHIVGVAMFFGSILARVTAGLIPGAADSPPAMLAARQAIALANWYVTIPGLILAVVSGAFMVANAGYLKRSRLGMPHCSRCRDRGDRGGRVDSAGAGA